MQSRKKKAASPPVVIHARTLEMVPRDQIKPYPKNARIHPADQLDALEAIIRANGWTRPLVLDEDRVIVVGHGAFEVSGPDRLAMTEIPCIIARGLSQTQIKALRLADNSIGARSQWDAALVSGEIVELLGDGFDVALTGFTMPDLAAFKVPGFTAEQQAEEAELTPSPPARPRVRPGELWLLGDHRLVIGDSTDAKVVAKLLGDAKPHLMVTDPPYGVSYDPAWRDRAAKFSPSMGNRKDTAKGRVQNDDRADWTQAWALFPGAVAYVWHAPTFYPEVVVSLESVELMRRSQIVWGKQHLVIGRADYHWQHELCAYHVRKGAKGHWSGDRKQTTLWDIAKPQKSETGHSTQKPIECMRRPILNNSKPGDAVYDPFAGSGTTLIACEMEKRRCLAVELDPVYAEVIITRWEKFTGKTATREDGKTLAALKPAKAKAA